MSSFNKPYRTDAQLKADAEEKQRRDKLKSKAMKNKLADLIFKAVIEDVENGIDNFSKAEMIKKVAGETKLSAGDWAIWNNACNAAINTIRRYYWNDKPNVTDKRMFNYVRDMERYWLIPVEYDKDSKLAANVVYEEYDRKIKGIGEKMTQIATSAYLKIVKLDPVERHELIKKLREQNLLNNGGN